MRDGIGIVSIVLMASFPELGSTGGGTIKSSRNFIPYALPGLVPLRLLSPLRPRRKRAMALAPVPTAHAYSASYYGIVSMQGHDGLFARRLPIAFTCFMHLDVKGFCRRRFDRFDELRRDQPQAPGGWFLIRLGYLTPPVWSWSAESGRL